MNYSFNLCDPQKDVPPSKQRPTPLRLVINHQGKQYRKNIGISVKPCEFKRQRTKNDANNRQLLLIETRLGERLNHFSTPEDIRAAIDYAMTGEDAKEEKKKEGVGFWEFFKEWSERDTPSLHSRQLAYKRVSGMMGTEGTWEDINEAWYTRFARKCKDEKLSLNYVATLTAKVKTVLIEGRKLGFHDSMEYKKFAYKWETADTVALSQSEVDALWGADLKGRDAMARDLFILGVYTASRFSDYSRISRGNIVGGRIQFVQKKTGGGVLLPLSSRVSEVLERNGGASPNMTEQEMGRRIKEICKNLGGSFLETYDVKKTKGGRVCITRLAKWQRVSAHTARRTGATILHLAGVPDFQLMKLTGHKTIQNLQKYLKISNEDNASILANLDFFK